MRVGHAEHLPLVTNNKMCSVLSVHAIAAVLQTLAQLRPPSATALSLASAHQAARHVKEPATPATLVYHVPPAPLGSTQ
jgi:hypothetical protein